SRPVDQEQTVAASSTAAVQAANKPTKASPKPGKTRSDDDPRSTATDVSRGKVLQNRYQIKDILGQGGFGAAYLAADIKLRRDCVVKRMIIPPGSPPKQIELYQANFFREASLLAQLNQPGHPNIPEIYDYFSDENGNSLVMKFIEGPNLKSITKDGPMPWREAVRYATAISDALQYMHTHGDEPIMHRDIKPDNILLGNDNRLWLVDFGLAKADPVEGSGKIGASMAAGTLGYTPLEQWLGEAVPASDVYALGVTLHHLVTGLNPAESLGGEFNVQKLTASHGKLTPLRKINKELPQALNEVIAGATAAEPEQRLTALQLKEQLAALISGTQAAALYTFKSGESAKTSRELVDLCEKYRKEGQAYLYHGDFQRWFRMINRNDLVEAAEQAVKQGNNQKDGLEKFLKLLVPNLALKRFGRATRRLVRAVVVLLLLVVILFGVIAVVGSMAAGRFIEQSISTYAWNFNKLSLDEPNNFTEAQLNQGAEALVGAYLDQISIDMRPPDLVEVNGSWGGLQFNIPLVLTLRDGKPNFGVTEVNGIPLPFIAANLSQGLNAGVGGAFRNSPVDFGKLTVTDSEVVVEVEASTQSGRPALPTATPTATHTPTATPAPTITPTPAGLALVTIFNETGEDIIVDIEGEQFEMSVDDSKAVEVEPGTYDYVVIFSQTETVVAEGQKEWAVKTYKWRIK
ncbi:MAG: serine/threonine protein kinase, partial [Anaerolineae bacterium]|nr:serine/threonine protein kinase [Anaerolineae bacterium]